MIFVWLGSSCHPHPSASLPPVLPLKQHLTGLGASPPAGEGKTFEPHNKNPCSPLLMLGEGLGVRVEREHTSPKPVSNWSGASHYS